MVGVPRSKACINCRTRRKGCDERRPSCSQCVRRGVVCEGYPNSFNIRFENPGAKKRSSHSSSLSRKCPSASPNQQLGQIILSGRKSLSPQTIIGPQILPLSCQQSAFQSQIYNLFFEQYLPHESKEWPRLETDLDTPASTTWLKIAGSLASNGSLLNTALAALTLDHVARSQRRKDFLHESRALYVKAIRGMNRILSEAKSDLVDDQTLAAVMALSVYEVSNFKTPYFMYWSEFKGYTQNSAVTQAEGWFSHVRGAQALIKLRGSRNFSNSFGEKLFLGSRNVQLITAVGSRRATAADASWPNSDETGEMSSHIRLFEILQDLPGLMELADQMEPDPDMDVTQEMLAHYTAKLISLADKSHQLRLRLEMWLTSLEAQNRHHHQGRLYWPEPSTLYSRLPHDSPLRKLPFQYFFCFPNAEIAQQIVLYWTGSLLIHSNLWLAKGRLHRAGYHPALSTATAAACAAFCGFCFADEKAKEGGDADDLLPEPFTRPRPHEALLIVQALEYFVHPDMGLTGSNFIGFPMSVAQACLQHFNAPELAWYDVVLARLRIMNGDRADEELSNSDGHPHAVDPACYFPV